MRLPGTCPASAGLAYPDERLETGQVGALSQESVCLVYQAGHENPMCHCRLHERVAVCL